MIYKWGVGGGAGKGWNRVGWETHCFRHLFSLPRGGVETPKSKYGAGEEWRGTAEVDIGSGGIN